jgi:hypothetical protein
MSGKEVFMAKYGGEHHLDKMFDLNHAISYMTKAKSYVTALEENPNINSKHLRDAMQMGNSYIRQAAVSHPLADTSLLRDAMGDYSHDVHEAALNNEHIETPDDVIHRGLHSDSTYVRRSAVDSYYRKYPDGDHEDFEKQPMEYPEY